MVSVASFHIEYTQLINDRGVALQPLPEFARDHASLIAMYRAMLLSRLFDQKAVALQRTGYLGTFPSALGQEAVGVGLASAMRPEDVLLPSYRDHAAQLLRGVAMQEILLYWSGDERGSDFAIPRHDFPNCIPIATQVCHAAGAAYACKLRHEPRVALCIVGDGATSKGDFHEGLNLAGVWQAPLVVIINNNQWAISLPRSRQSAAQTLAQKAIAAGIEGVQVDGNDVVAVRHAVQQALDQARSGGGPSVIEAISYRLGDHTTADDASRYRDAGVVQQQWALEPILRLRNYLAGIQAWDKEQEQALHSECAAAVEQAVHAFIATPAQRPEAMFDCLYATLPRALEEQRALAAAGAGASGAAHG
jgi:pyruvate dehydrogenase E1 component alpha subunit